MISTSFKKQLIANAYNTQLLPVTDIDKVGDKVGENSIRTIERIKNWLLFKLDYSIKSSWVDYKYKYNNIIFDNIDIDIHWFLRYLIDSFYSIYQYSEDKEYHIQKKILNDINHILYEKQKIDERPDYTEYLEEVYD